MLIGYRGKLIRCSELQILSLQYYQTLNIKKKKNSQTLQAKHENNLQGQENQTVVRFFSSTAVWGRVFKKYKQKIQIKYFTFHQDVQVIKAIKKCFLHGFAHITVYIRPFLRNPLQLTCPVELSAVFRMVIASLYKLQPLATHGCDELLKCDQQHRN